MKRFLLNLLMLMSLTAVALAGDSVDVRIPDKCFDILVPDTASYVVFLADQKTSNKDGQMRLKVASLKDGRGLWSRKYYPNRYVGVCDRGVIVGDAFDLVLYDFQTGKEIRKLTSRPLYFDYGKDLIIGLRGKGKLGCNLLSTGEKQWETKIGSNRGSRWKVVERPDENTLIIQSDYVGKINLVTGEIKSCPLKQSVFDRKSYWLSEDAAESFLTGSVFGAVGGLFFGALSLNSLDTQANSYDIGNFCSDVVKHDGRFFVSDRERLVCLDSDMNEVWQSILPKNAGSHAKLDIHGDTIEMVNVGYVESGNRRYKSGRPFRASFLAGIGESLYLYFFPEKWDEERFGKNLNFVTATVFVSDDSGENFSRLQFPREGAYVAAHGGSILHVDTDLNLIDSIDSDKVCYLVASLPDGHIVKSKGETPSFIRIGLDGKVIERYGSDHKGFIVNGHRLFKNKGDVLIVSELND